MPYGNSSTKIGSSCIDSNDEIIRHIMCKDFNNQTNTVKTSAFDTAKLSTEGISVSIERLLSPTIRHHIIRALEKGNKFTYICDYISAADEIVGIQDDNSNPAFNLNYSPLALNVAHADIKFSSFIASLTRAEHKKYRKLLMDVFIIK
ncbi:Uncharacterised protein [Legionella donaldsonii]|uniref:Uncharacterized protein n=1 Tax=Legionella donaldsonii TaxID=45060 RepID=A0A378IXZ6_9GAMM|nr:hypothetical protein [Legionella donaldsonii]STX40332.1 Uncharacterised protein [Legionella donaldsonii]